MWGPKPELGSQGEGPGKARAWGPGVSRLTFQQTGSGQDGFQVGLGVFAGQAKVEFLLEDGEDVG